MIGQPEASIYYGGSIKLYEVCMPLLKLLGGNNVHLSEDPGVPLFYDL